MIDKNLFYDLLDITSVSGNEDLMASFIEKFFAKFNIDFKKDSLGNITGYVCNNTNADDCINVFICTHMDETAFIVSKICDGGILRFETVGNIPDDGMLSKKVAFNNVNGVISRKAIHLLTKEERVKKPRQNDLYIDIGAIDKADANKYVMPGDCFVFSNDLIKLSHDYVSSRSSGDRGCIYTLLKLIQEVKTENALKNIKLTFCFTTSRHVASRGIIPILNTLAKENIPDYFITVDNFDINIDVKDNKEISDDKPSIFYIPNNLSGETLKKFGIDNSGDFSGSYINFDNSNELEIINNRFESKPKLMLGVPCRNKNTSNSVLNLKCPENSVQALKKLITNINKGGRCNE